mmetsp:Transcript_41226/g.94832  ORF Transcript_41226/g.94832 Transcript_41226/m.94832 type:complete len:595 (+) Transcript_41226:89-1873(+)
MFHDASLPAQLIAPMSVVPTSFEPNAIGNSQIAQLQLVAAAVDMQTQAARVRAEVAAAVQWAHLKREVEQQLAEQQMAQAQHLRRLPPGLCDPTPCERVPQKVLQLPPTALLAAALADQQAMLESDARKPKQRPQDLKQASTTPPSGKFRGSAAPGEVDPKAVGCHETMRSHLQALRNEDPRCIVITRRIGKLGFHSKDILSRYFQKFGQVRQVLVAHSKVKPFGDTDSYPRQRPGNFGLLLMKDMDTVHRILAEGPTLTVAGVEIQVQPFYRVDEGAEEEDDGGINGPGSCQGACEDDHFSERSTVCTNTSDNGMGHPRQTSSSSSMSDETHVSSAQSAASPQHEETPKGSKQAVEDMNLAQALLELSHLTKETAYLAQWGQMRFKQLEEQCHQRAAQLDGRGALPQQNVEALPVPVPAPMSLLQPMQHQSRLNEMPPTSGERKEQAKSHGKEKSSQSKTRMQMACFSESSPPARDTLRGHLTQLASENESCIFIARRINKLGFGSREILEKHFSKFGEVARVLVAHSRVRNVREMDGQVWVRPGGLGLIVMKDARVVEQILANGEEQTVAGHAVRVQTFQRPKGALESLADE